MHYISCYYSKGTSTYLICPACVARRRSVQGKAMCPAVGMIPCGHLPGTTGSANHPSVICRAYPSLFSLGDHICEIPMHMSCIKHKGWTGLESRASHPGSENTSSTAGRVFLRTIWNLTFDVYVGTRATLARVSLFFFPFFLLASTWIPCQVSRRVIWHSQERRIELSLS